MDYIIRNVPLPRLMKLRAGNKRSPGSVVEYWPEGMKNGNQEIWNKPVLSTRKRADGYEITRLSVCVFSLFARF